MKQLQLITKNQRKRTLKLLQDVKMQHGISGYLLMKKMLTVSILTEHFQNKYRHESWIPYEDFLARNERAIKHGLDLNRIKENNGLSKDGLKATSFFGISSLTVLDKSLNDVEVAVIEKWNKDIRGI